MKAGDALAGFPSFPLPPLVVLEMRMRLKSLAALALVTLAGCTTDAINKDSRNTFLDSTDLVTMTDRMAQSIIADPDVQRVVAERPMVIVMKPIINETNQLIRKGEKELYVHRVRVLLSSKPELRNKFVFVLNRDDYEKLRNEESLTPEQLGMPEQRVQPEYALTGTFYSSTNTSRTRRDDTYLCTFRLTKLQGEGTGVQLWEGSYETSKHVKKEFLD
jgi:PBP1b-binding outer membrane lipoprotein LpoB